MARASAWASELRWAAALEVLLGVAKAWASAWQLGAASEALLAVELDLETLGEASAAEPAAALGRAWDLASGRCRFHPFA